MLVFRVDEQNFGGGDRDGVRIVTGQGLKVDFDELVPDGQTLGLWHLHNGACQGEGTGLENAKTGGPNLTNVGATALDDGYQFDRTFGQSMSAPYPGKPIQSALTLELWMRNWAVPLDQVAYIAAYERIATRRIFLAAMRATVPANSYFFFRSVSAAGTFTAQWTGAAVDALLASASPMHVAGVFQPLSSHQFLFINGVQRASAAPTLGLAAGDYDLFLGNDETKAPATFFGGILDEVRLSSSVRYTSNFTPYRLLASGIYTSPTFDAVRRQADWLDLLVEQITPSGTTTTWEVRAADQADAFGNPQAVWAPYSGNPADLPNGRYFQWRATLSTSADRLTSPTIVSVEAQASEAGYNLYHATGSGPDSLDYAAPWAEVGPGVNEAETEALDTSAVHWFGIRPVDARGIESPITQSEARIELDASGAPVPDRPAGALAIGAQAMPLGAVRLTWRYRPGITGVVPQVFRIFGDGGGGTIDYGSPLGEVAYEMGRVAYAATIEGLASGVEHQLAVRAVAQGEVWGEQPATAPVTPDADAPGEVAALEAEVVL